MITMNRIEKDRLMLNASASAAPNQQNTISASGAIHERSPWMMPLAWSSTISTIISTKAWKRPGTPAADLPDQVAKEVVSQRYQRLIKLQETISLEENAAQIGRTVEVLVAAGEGRKDTATARMSGRARDGRLVHFAPGPDAGAIRPGDVVVTTVTGAAPHHLIADATLIDHRRTRAGDAHDSGQRPRTGVGLGMPGVGVPAQPEPVAAGCSR